jgi:hypothetical protein
MKREPFVDLVPTRRRHRGSRPTGPQEWWLRVSTGTRSRSLHLQSANNTTPPQAASSNTNAFPVTTPSSSQLSAVVPRSHRTSNRTLIATPFQRLDHTRRLNTRWFNSSETSNARSPARQTTLTGLWERRQKCRTRLTSGIRTRPSSNGSMSCRSRTLRALPEAQATALSVVCSTTSSVHRLSSNRSS